MNRFLLSFIQLGILLSCGAQEPGTRGEFAIHANGLMYQDKDMKILRHIVDSLNLRYKTCDLDRTYYSCLQGNVYYVSFKSETDDLKQITRDMDNNAGFFEVINKYKPLVKRMDTGYLLVRNKSTRENERYTYLKGKPSGGFDGFYMAKEHKQKQDLAGTWSYDYSPKSEYSKSYELICHYFPEKLKQQPLPAAYGRLVQYVDCMIDTSATVYLTDKFGRSWFANDEKAWYDLKELADYLDAKMGQPKKQNGRLRQLTDAQMAFAGQHLLEDLVFREILSHTIDAYVKKETPQQQLETLAEKMQLYDKALLLKRCYRVMGMCSMDSSPREHARDIALLAARSHSWDIFLRAHLDIMNDRFERASDGSYAYGERQTYLKELEELNLNIVDLVLGLTLRADNVADNHYYGTIWRMGRALAESRDKKRFEEKAFSMMKDPALDAFNRGLVFLLYSTYLNYLDDREKQKGLEKLKTEQESFPYFIRASIIKITTTDPKNRK